MTVQLVTTDSVRAVLGVSAKELPDAVLSNSIYSVRLKEDLYDLHPQMVADFATFSALPSPTSTQQRFLDIAETYAAYNVANQCLTSLPMFSPLTLKDEKAELTRNADFYDNLRDDVGAVLSLMRAKLQTVYALLNASAPAPALVSRVYAAAIGLGTDPVTGV